MALKLTQKDITDLLKTNPLKNVDEKIKQKNLEIIQNKLFKYNECKSVLGIDIYRYSQYSRLPQMFIPSLFKRLYDSSIEHCLKLEPTIFKGFTKNSFTDYFIDTGDGGFQIFDNPFQAIIFLIYFQSNVSRYNSMHDDTLNEFIMIDEITLRYSLTHDDIYSFENNHYGPAIINCARIMAKDKLNRFLIDENTQKWFTKEINGIENLQFIDLPEDSSLSIFNKSKPDEIDSVVYEEEGCKIKHVDLMKIGEIKSKLDTLSIYNLRILILMISPSSKFEKHAITIGNSNSSGLSD
ncbi:hypothetical protein [Flavobacterium wongokense]|uniref:hypothetical protein n=1 Tax=Flavobacterium wongokense TaxID=2910674 RepID=UPI001F1722FF|nr:hypothetical protein [Flavobacterium sp. WG47]MCF6131933.1 hypothetical protein [Flavobacterium sp. WG47]